MWFTKPVDAHRECPKCSGKVRLWYKGEDILRVTARKDQYGEVEDWICNECRFEKKKTADWVIEGPSKVDKHSVISANHYLAPEMKNDLSMLILNPDAGNNPGSSPFSKEQE